MEIDKLDIDKALEAIDLDDPLEQLPKRQYLADLKELAWAIEFMSSDDPKWRSPPALAFLVTGIYLRGRGIKQRSPRYKTSRDIYETVILLQLLKLARSSHFRNVEKTIRWIAINGWLMGKREARYENR